MIDSRLQDRLGVLVLSVVKHDYIARGVALHPRFKLVAVADDANQPDWVHERNDRFAKEFDLPYFRNVEQAIAESDVQVAVVSSQAERHGDLSVRAIQSGLHVIQDKPMSTSLSACDRVVEAVSQHDVRFLMWNRSLLPSVVLAREQVAGGEIGELIACHVDFYFAKDAGPPVGTRRPGDPPLDWLEALKAAHATGADGGVGKQPMGELTNEGCYPLAYLSQLTDAKVSRVFARATSHFHQLHADNGVEDLATVTLEYDTGLVGSIALGRIGNASHPDLGDIKMHLIGTQGALVINEPRPEVGIFYRDQPATEFRHVRLNAEQNDFLLADNFARAIDGEVETILDAVKSREITAVLLAALESSRTGQVVEVS